MPKSKIQKQQEAIERARVRFPLHAAHWREVWGSHEQLAGRFGVAHADKMIRQETLVLIKHMKLAKCDAHGNPVVDPKALEQECDKYRRMLNTKLTSPEVPAIPFGTNDLKDYGCRYDWNDYMCVEHPALG